MNLEINNNLNKKSSKSSFSEELENYINKTNTLFSIDRFEGNFAICENKQTQEIVNIQKNLLPINATEGDIIRFVNGKYILDIEQTKKEREDIKNLVDNLFKRKNEQNKNL